MISRYADSIFSDIWSDTNKYKTWYEVEFAVCECMEKKGIIPIGTCKLMPKYEKESFEIEKILKIEEETGHDVISFLTYLEKNAFIPRIYSYFHLGMTSSDLLDTTTSILLNKCNIEIEKEYQKLLKILCQKCFDYKDTLIIGRTHGVHAEPTTLGMVFTNYYTELRRNYEKFILASDDVRVGKISGAVGNYTNIEPEIELEVLEKFGLRADPCSSQVISRDRIANYICVLGQTAVAIERIAVNIRNYHRTEIGEIKESFSKTQKGSSAMPHKQNPILSENLCGLSRVIRGYITPALENCVLWHERDISHSSVERMMIPDVTSLIHFMIKRCSNLLKNLVINENKIKENLLLQGSNIHSQSLLTALVKKGLRRQEAYEIIQKCINSGENLINLWNKEKKIEKILTWNEFEECFSFDRYKKNINIIYERVFKEGKVKE